MSRSTRRRGPVSFTAAVPGLARTVRRLRPWLAPQRPLLAGGAAAMVAEVLLRLLEPWPLKLILDRVIQPDARQAATGLAWADAMAPLDLLLLAAVAFVVITAARAGAAYLATVAVALAGNRVLTAVRGELYRHLQRLSLAYHTKARSGDLLTRVVGDVGRLQEVAVTAALPLTVNLATLAGMVGVMVWLDWQLTMIALAALPLFALTMRRQTKRIRTVAREQRQAEGELASVAAESLGAMEVVHAYSLAGTFDKSFASQNRKNLTEGVRGKRLAAGLERKTDLLIAVATGLVLYFGARRVLAGVLTPGDLVVFATYLKTALKPLRDLAKYTGRIAKAAASGERIVDVLDTVPTIRDRPGARPLGRVRGQIRFDDVWLAYEPGRDALRGVDLTALAGETVALVGPSGAGKSSVVALLLRLYDPDYGKVEVDGFDVRGVRLDDLRRQIAIVLQDSVLFATTIRDNIAYGCDGVTLEQIEAAARLANAHDFIQALPDGYDTVVGERGVTLSGGERQRIAIARAAVRDAPIVILDEPTTGLDRASERVVMEALRRLSRDRTTIHIAHDLHTVTHADRILFLEDGEVVESGTHSQLLARDGRYAAMLRRQHDAATVPQPAIAPAGEAVHADAR